MRELEPLLDTAGVARIFLVSSTTVRRWLADGKLRSVRVGRELRFRAADIERLVNQEPADQRPDCEPRAAAAAGGVAASSVLAQIETNTAATAEGVAQLKET